MLSLGPVHGWAVSCAAAACVVLAGCGGAATSSVGAIGAGLQGPDGVKAGVYATGLLHVSAFAFDARGRLWAAASGASAHGRDGVFVVARAGARPVKMISGLKGPLGLVWHDGVLYVSSLGRVTAFSELRGARFGQRTTIVRGPAGGGENNNLVLAVGARGRSTGPEWGAYTVDPAALRHGAGVERETTEPDEAYARFHGSKLTRYRDGWLGGETPV